MRYGTRRETGRFTADREGREKLFLDRAFGVVLEVVDQPTFRTLGLNGILIGVVLLGQQQLETAFKEQMIAALTAILVDHDSAPDSTCNPISVQRHWNS